MNVELLLDPDSDPSGAKCSMMASPRRALSGGRSVLTSFTEDDIKASATILHRLTNAQHVELKKHVIFGIIHAEHLLNHGQLFCIDACLGCRLSVAKVMRCSHGNIVGPIAPAAR